MEEDVLRYTNLLIISGIMKNYHSSGRNLRVITVPVYNKGDTDILWCYVSTTCTILSETVLLILTHNADEITGSHQRSFRRNGLTTAQLFCIRQILQKK